MRMMLIKGGCLLSLNRCLGSEENIHDVVVRCLLSNDVGSLNK